MRRPRFDWRLDRRSDRQPATRTLALGERTIIMGVLNVTPDSFSDGGEFADTSHAVAHALRMMDEGADIVDVGGESTRPGKKERVTPESEKQRVLPVIESILRSRPEAVLSVDTYHSEVARAAVESGALIVNDVSGFQWDSNMAETIASLGCGAVLMHTRGRPEQWHSLPPLTAPVETVMRELAYFAGVALKFGVARESLVLDPGFGFGKSHDENYPLLAHFDELHKLGFPLLSGTSRKSFIGRTLAQNGADLPPDRRGNGTLATVVASILKGAHIVRVHDVRPAVEAAKIADAILAAL